MGMAVGGNKGSMSEPNIVPLIDVLLVLIIIFMVITPTIPQGLDALVPQPAPPNQKQDDALLAKTIVVQVTADGKVMINQDKTSWDQLLVRAWKIFSNSAPKKWRSSRAMTPSNSPRSLAPLISCEARESRTSA